MSLLRRLAPPSIALTVALAGCPRPDFMNRDGVSSGGRAAPDGRVPVNSVRMTGGNPFGEPSAEAPAPAAPRRSRIGDRDAYRPYEEDDHASYPGYSAGGSGDDGLLDQDIYAATDAGALPKMPDLYPVGPGAMPHVGIEVNPASFQDGLYSPDSPARMMNRSDDITNLMRMTYTERGGDRDVTLTRDGRHLVYATTRWGKNPQIVRQRVGGKAIERLTQSNASDLMPAISPDNQVLVWTSNRFGAWNLLARELDAPPQASPLRLTQSDSDDLHPTWSHDGRLLAFSRYNPMDAQWELWVMDFQQGKLLTCVGPGLFPAFAPVAKRTLAEGQPVYTLAFQHHRQRDIPFYSVWTMEIAFRHGRIEAVGAPSEIVGSPEWAAITPVWSPDGEYLAFATVRQSPMARAQGRLYQADQVWAVRADGTEPTPITDHAAPSWYPYWAPEESNPRGRIYFVSLRNGHPNVWSKRPNIPGMLYRYARRGQLPDPR